MSVKEKIKMWRGLGHAVNTRVGARTYELVGGAVNKAAGLAAPRLDGPIPWASPRRPLADSTVTLISTAGFHQAGDEPFDVDAADGDSSFREIPSGCDPATLSIAHAHYPHVYAEQDPNVLLPLDRLRELEQAGVCGLAPRLFSFGFGGVLTRAYVAEPDGSAHRLARELQRDEVDLALLVPA